jgi:hypothetical protein
MQTLRLEVFKLSLTFLSQKKNILKHFFEAQSITKNMAIENEFERLVLMRNQ